MAVHDLIFRVCPTRIDHSGVLFAHKVATKKCRERQRTLYHKCFTCAWSDSYVSLNGEPSREHEVVAETEPKPQEISSLKS